MKAKEMKKILKTLQIAINKENNENTLNNIEKPNNNKTESTLNQNKNTENNVKQDILSKIFPFTGKNFSIIYAIIASCIISGICYIRYKRITK